MRILIVDDLHSKIKWIEEFLKQKDIEYEVVSYFTKAYQKILTLNYDGIILDMQFPILENSPIDSKAGEKLVKRMKHRNINIPVLGNSMMVKNFPNSYEYPFIKGKLNGYRTWNDEIILLEFLESIEEQSR